MGKLTDKQERFCREYIIDLNAKQAAIRTGYSEATAEQQASRLLSNVKVQEFVDKLQKEIADSLGIDAQFVTKRFLEIHDRCMQVEPVMVKINGEWQESGEYKFDAANATRALENIGKHVGYYEKDNKQKQNDQNVHLYLPDNGRDNKS